jgi:mono/diheme cytochrome c family protein
MLYRCGVASLWLSFELLAQAGVRRPERAGNPLAGDAEAIRKGQALFGARCAPCHGPDARGGRAPGLDRSRIVVLAPDRRFFELIQNGIPGSEMAPLDAPEEQVWQIIAFVHSLAKPGLGPPVPGDVEAGRRLFDSAGCRQCHMIDGHGGVLGPDLSSVALQNTSSRIRNPSPVRRPASPTDSAGCA